MNGFRSRPQLFYYACLAGKKSLQGTGYKWEFVITKFDCNCKLDYYFNYFLND